MSRDPQDLEVTAPAGFDLRVTHRDPRTGAITKVNPYTLRIIGRPEGGRTRIYERPVGSGNMWDAKGKPVGRWINGKFAHGVEHIEYVEPLTGDAKLAKDLLSKDAKISELEKELAGIKSDKKPTQPAAKKANDLTGV